MTPEEAYRALELPADATPEQVQDAYRKAALRLHPDKAAGYGLHDRKQWLRVRDAYELLRSSGFPQLAPAEIEVPKPRGGPKPYKAPEWLERKWASEKGERIADHLALDDHERRALIRTVFWVASIVISVLLVIKIRQQLQERREFSPRPGWTVSW